MQATHKLIRHQAAVNVICLNLDKPAHVRQKISVWDGALLATLSLTLFILAAQATFGIPPASAGSHYGILGSQAPELDMDTWIDGRGEKTAPIQLRAYRGKVIYLYFFQDW